MVYSAGSGSGTGNPSTSPPSSSPPVVNPQDEEFYASWGLCILCVLLIGALITSYYLQVRRIRAVHETVVSIFSGMIVGLVIRMSPGHLIREMLVSSTSILSLSFSRSFFSADLVPVLHPASSFVWPGHSSSHHLNTQLFVTYRCLPGTHLLLHPPPPALFTSSPSNTPSSSIFFSRPSSSIPVMSSNKRIFSETLASFSLSHSLAHSSAPSVSVSSCTSGHFSVLKVSSLHCSSVLSLDRRCPLPTP